jgi:hypothetical protein
VLNSLAFIVIIVLIDVAELSKFKAFPNYRLSGVCSKAKWLNEAFALTIYLSLIIAFWDHSF